METVPHSVYSVTDVYVEQESVPEADRKDEQGILIKIEFKRAIYNRPNLGSPCELGSSRGLRLLHCLMSFDLIKKIRSPYRKFCRGFFADRISSGNNLIDIPKETHRKALRMLFQALDEAVNPELPIVLEIWYITVRTWGHYESRINFVPASRDSIEGLERLRLQILESETCAICLEDYDEPAVLVTRLPCSHYFHGDCIALWLHTHHICPLCRFAMPTTPQQL